VIHAGNGHAALYPDFMLTAREVEESATAGTDKERAKGGPRSARRTLVRAWTSTRCRTRTTRTKLELDMTECGHKNPLVPRANHAMLRRMIHRNVVVMLWGFTVWSCGPAASEIGAEQDSPTEELGERRQALGTCGPSCCDIRQFGAVAGDGQDDAAGIQAAISAALSTSHRYVYIPIGTWDIASSIDLTSGQASRVWIAGEHSKGTRLRWMNNLNYSMFNTGGGYSYFKVDLRTMTIDGSHLSWASGSGHGVRAGNGWDSGYLHMANLNIIHPGFYGVGIQNGDPGDKPARSVWLASSYVANTGSDGIDLKAPPDANNYDVQINNVVFANVGNSVRALDANGSGSDAAIDMTAEGFGIYRVTIVTDAYKQFNDVWHPVYSKYVSGTNVIQGIRLRRRGDSWSEPAARDGSINRAYIKYAERGIFFEGWNRDIVIQRTAIKSVPLQGIYLRGVDNEIDSSVCVVASGSLLYTSSSRGGASTTNNVINGPTTTCIAMSEVGALTTNRDSNNLVDVGEPMNCNAAP
jgi:hypothetical protein